MYKGSEDWWEEYLKRDEVVQSIKKAREAHKERLKMGPCASTVKYDSSTNYIVIHFKNDTIFMFPPYKVRGLSGSKEELESLWIDDEGLYIHCDNLDIKLNIRELLKGNFDRN